jgi:hypothetical protein
MIADNKRGTLKLDVRESARAGDSPASTTLDARHLSVRKSDGTRLEIEWPATLVLTHGTSGTTASYDLGQGNVIAGPGIVEHYDNVVSLSDADSEYVWQLA